MRRDLSKHTFHDVRRGERKEYEVGRTLVTAPEGGSFKRCGCLFDRKLDKRFEDPSCDLHGAIPEGGCERCGDRRWLSVGVGWRGWMLAQRCPVCHPLPKLEDLSDLCRRIAPCNSVRNKVLIIRRRLGHNV